MIKVTSFYKFFPIEKESLKKYRKQLLEEAQKSGLRGLILIGEEGINATICGKEQSVEDFKEGLHPIFKETFFWKDSYCKKWNFKRLSIRIKKDIINIGDLGLPPIKEKEGYLSPSEWEKKLKNHAQILDVRNIYEVDIGKFRKAKDLRLNSFQEFSEKLPKLSLDKSKDTLIYCTGGIRCEKAMEVMKEQGFKKIYQLEGGILNYLKEYPNSHFEKECFVFDHRVSVDQNLQASKKYSLCPHCGQPGDIKISCQHCEKPAVICKLCKEKFSYYKTCSKNCAYHFKSGHNCRKKHKSNLSI